MKLTGDINDRRKDGDESSMFRKFKVLPSLLLLILAFAAALLPGRTALAAGSFGISRYEATYEVQSNGSVKVTETIEFDIQGDINGVFRDVDTNLGDRLRNTTAKPVGIDFVSAAVVENGTERVLYMTDEGTGRAGLFEFYEGDKQNIYRFKVFEPSSDERKSIRFRYTLTNAVVKFNDIATLNWNMVDANWGVPIENVKITIRIPQGAAKSDLKIFSHGDLTGFNEILNETTFNVEIPLVDPGAVVENLVIFPLSLVPDSQNIVAVTELPRILEEEARYAEEANQAREEAKARVEAEKKRLEDERLRRETGRTLSPFILALGAIGAAVAGFIGIRYGRERKPQFTGDYYRELPGDYTPAVMSYLLERGTQSKDIMATLMDLARKDILSIEPYQTVKRSLFGEKSETDYRLRSQGPTEQQLSKLMAHERFLYDWFINDLGDGQTLAMDDLESLMKRQANAYQFNRDYAQFKGYVTGQGEAMGFREANKTTGSAVFYLVGLVFMAGGAFVLLRYFNFLGVVPIIAGVAVIAVNASMYFKRKLTQYGADQTAMWKAFKNFLLTFSNMDKAEIPALAIWNHYLVYATSLGVAKEVIDQLPKVYTMQQLQDPTFTRTFYPDFYFGRGYMMMDRSLNQAISTANQTIQKAEAVAASRRSSSSGGGGGFSGGSSGGGGGGGGGGVF